MLVAPQGIFIGAGLNIYASLQENGSSIRMGLTDARQCMDLMRDIAIGNGYGMTVKLKTIQIVYNGLRITTGIGPTQPAQCESK